MKIGVGSIRERLLSDSAHDFLKLIADFSE